MQAPENPQPRYHILIIDPDAEFAGLVAQAIDDAAGTYRVVVDSDAQETLTHVREAQVAQHPFDLLIADVNAPGSSSMRMIKELAQSYPELKIVTMTASHSPELMGHLQQLGVYTHLVKPVPPSEIRQIVHNAWTGKDSDTSRASLPPPLDSAKLAAVERQLANLRRATQSTAALLVHASGAIQAMDCMDPDLDASTLGLALIDAQRAIAQSLAQTMRTPTRFRQSYFGTDSYSICIHRLDDTSAVATIFGPEVREGQMWYAIREASEALQKALESKEQATPAPRGQARNDGFDMVERYFSQQDTRKPQRRSTHERGNRSPRQPSTPTQALETLPPAPAEEETPSSQKSPTHDPTAEQSSSAPGLEQVLPSLPPPLEMERLEIDELNWNLDDGQDWDTLGADTDQAFQGMTFEEAKEQGLLGDLEASDQDRTS